MSCPIIMTGKLRTEARAWRSTDTGWTLCVEFLAPSPLRTRGSAAPKPVQVRALKVYGTGDAAGVACKSRAYRLQRDVRVVVAANQAHMVRGKLELMDVDDLQAPDIDGAERWREAFR